MIIDLKFENWMSFRNETDFCLVATSERRLNARVPKVKKAPTLKVSPISVLYGGNASGKSNLFSLLAFLKHMIVKPISDEKNDIPVEGFALEQSPVNVPTKITITFLAENDSVYKYNIHLNRSSVLLESLVLITSSSEKVLFARNNNIVKLELEPLKKNKTAQAFATIVNKNQLFLAIAGSRVEQLNKAYSWFCDQLTLLNTNSTFGGFNEMFSEEQANSQTLAALMSDLDTGICKLALENAEVSALPPGLPEKLKEKLSEDSVVEVNFGGSRFIVSKNNNIISVKKLVSFHKNAQNNDIEFDLTRESEGSLRLLDILPAFIDLGKENSSKVYVIDELDRSWHYALSRRLLGIFLSSCSEKSRAQLIFSTHDLMLMDQDLFRRDEMWVVERSDSGNSDIFPLANCGVRYDKDIRKLYLQGALGGIPKLVKFGSLDYSNKER